MRFVKTFLSRFRGEPELLITSPPAEAPKPFKMPALVEVVDCCGAYGWLIPWAPWKCGPVPITSTRDFQRLLIRRAVDGSWLPVPITSTRDFQRPYIYLYLGHSPGGVIPRKRGDQPSYDVCLDPFIDFDSKQADWEGVRRDILAQAERRARAEQSS